MQRTSTCPIFWNPPKKTTMSHTLGKKRLLVQSKYSWVRSHVQTRPTVIDTSSMTNPIKLNESWWLLYYCNYTYTFVVYVLRRLLTYGVVSVPYMAIFILIIIIIRCYTHVVAGRIGRLRETADPEHFGGFQERAQVPLVDVYFAVVDELNQCL